MKTRIMLAALATTALVAVAAPADATRPGPGYEHPDLCKNKGAHAMPGKQTVSAITVGRIRYVDPEQEPNKVGRRDCEALRQY